MDFRDDINMLRALAVAGVVLFHLGATLFPGGFAGVDVFFVISGFLMTRIIMGGVDRGDFSFARFMLARAKRIIPALLVLVFVLLVLGYFFLSPKHYEWLGRDAGSAVVFASNMLFAKKIDYFAPAGEPSWLLHTWSLSVEWQFYVLFPLCVMVFRHFLGRERMVEAMIAAAVVSFLANVVWTQMAQAQAFYALGTRVWMFVAGGLVSFFPRVRPGKIQAGAGLALVLASYLFLDETKGYPGLWSVMPVLGAVLVIHANAQSAWMRHPVVAWTGKLSYSLYLWHWPVVVFAVYAGMLHPVYMPVWLLLSFALAWASLTWVEEPFRRSSTPPPPPRKGGTMGRALAGYALAVLCLYALASVVHGKEGFVARVPAHLVAAQDALASVYPRQKDCMDNAQGCRIGGALPVRVALWGDSHADALAPAFEKALADAGTGGRIYALSACPPVPEWVPQISIGAFRGWSLQGCRDFNHEVLAGLLADEDLRVVILAASWIGYANVQTRIFGGAGLQELHGDERSRQLEASFVQTVCALSSAGKRVYVVAPVPVMPFSQALSDLKRGFLRLSLIDAAVTRDDYDRSAGLFQGMVASVPPSCPVGIIDVAEKLCPKGLCRAKVAAGYLYRDSDHLTVAGALMHTSSFSAVLP